MGQRFRFIAPTPREMAFLKRWKWGGIFAWLLPYPLFVLFEMWPLTSPGFWFVSGLVIISFLIKLRLSDIRRREAQARFGFVELSTEELCVSLSFRSALHMEWRNFRGAHVHKGWLSFQSSHSHAEWPPENGRLNRVRLHELETPDDLLDALRAQTASSR